MTEFSSCPKCDFQTSDAVTFCQQCGGRMLSSIKVRKMGWMALIAGGLLVVLMTFIMVWETTTDARWTGTAALWRYMMIEESVVVMLGVVGIVAGIWQIKHGMRNKMLTYIISGCAVVLGAMVMWQLTGKD